MAVDRGEGERKGHLDYVHSSVCVLFIKCQCLLGTNLRLYFATLKILDALGDNV